MLNRAHRLRRRSEFTDAVRAGRRAGRSTLVVHLRHTDQDVPPRVGFVVSRGVGGAVVRNQVQRRLRHLAREHLPELAPGTMLVVRAQPAAATARTSRLRSDLAGALRAARRGSAASPANGRRR